MAKKRVLIVDDDVFFRTVTREILERAGYEPLEAADGTAALAKAERLQPDVILLDVMMPGLDGYEVCRQLKGNPATKHIPVLFVTVVGDVALNRRAYQAGAAACIPKPFRPETLVTLIASALRTAEVRAKPKAKGGGDES